MTTIDRRARPEIHSIGRDRDGFTTVNGRRVYWPANRDSDGRRSFILPGEPYPPEHVLKRREREFMAQVRGGSRSGKTLDDEAAAALKAARRLLHPLPEPDNAASEHTR